MKIIENGKKSDSISLNWFCHLALFDVSLIVGKVDRQRWSWGENVSFKVIIL